MRTIEQMVQSEVMCCMSSLVSTLATGYGLIDRVRGSHHRELGELAEQAFELASPVPDYEEAAIQVGWRSTGPLEFTHSEGRVEAGDSWETLCNDEEIEPYYSEVFEHWAVTEWFADKLIEAGEKVDKDFGNLCIWARTTTGQGIASDGVVERIYAAMMAPVEA